jgi:hypothetical protein
MPRISLLTFGVLLIGGTLLAVLFAAAVGHVLVEIFPNGGMAVFAAYFVVHVMTLVGVLGAVIRWASI